MPLVLLAKVAFSGYAAGDAIGGDATIAAVLGSSVTAAKVLGTMVGNAHAITESYAADPMTFYGSGSPASNLGGNQCTYVDITTTDIWINNGTAWANSGAQLRGPATTDSVAAHAMTSRSVASTVAATSSPLMAANPFRTRLLIAAPQTTAIWINPLGGAAAPNGADCVEIPEGTTYTVPVPTAITYYCATATLEVTAFEG